MNDIPLYPNIKLDYLLSVRILYERQSEEVEILKEGGKAIQEYQNIINKVVQVLCSKTIHKMNNQELSKFLLYLHKERNIVMKNINTTISEWNCVVNNPSVGEIWLF